MGWKLSDEQRLEIEPHPDVDYKKVDCFIRAIHDAGFKLGFVGNEAPGNNR